MKPTTMMILMTTILAACHTQQPASAPARQLSPDRSAEPSGERSGEPSAERSAERSGERSGERSAELSGELGARRAQLIGWLHEYYEAGQFPTDEAGQPESVFVDAKGVRCPMAELIWRTGHHDLVEAVAREHNAVRLAEVTEGPLHDWMLGSGLTLDEINLVQGAMDLDMTWMHKETGEVILANGGRVELAPNNAAARTTAIIARAEIRGRLETAERALTDGTAHSLSVATAQLPNGKLPAVSVTGNVVPKTALRSGPQFPHAPPNAPPHAPPNAPPHAPPNAPVAARN